LTYSWVLAMVTFVAEATGREFIIDVRHLVQKQLGHASPDTSPKVAPGAGNQGDTLCPEEKTGRGWGQIRPLEAEKRPRCCSTAERSPKSDRRNGGGAGIILDLIQA